MYSLTIPLPLLIKTLSPYKESLISEYFAPLNGTYHGFRTVYCTFNNSANNKVLVCKVWNSPIQSTKSSVVYNTYNNIGPLQVPTSLRGDWESGLK